MIYVVSVLALIIAVCSIVLSVKTLQSTTKIVEKLCQQMDQYHVTWYKDVDKL